MDLPSQIFSIPSHNMSKRIQFSVVGKVQGVFFRSGPCKAPVFTLTNTPTETLHSKRPIAMD